MTNFDKAAGAGTLRLSVTVASQNIAANTSVVDWQLLLYCYNGASYHLDNTIAWNTKIGGNNYSGTFSFDFRSSTVKLIASGSTTITHNASGYSTIYSSGFKGVDATSITNNVTTGGNYTLPRIPKAPLAPSGLTKGTETTSSVALSWTAPDDMGASITGYQVQYATDAGFTTDLGTQTFASTSGTVTGLTPGPAYYFRVRAENSRGWGPYSTSITGSPALPAPTFSSWAQNDSGGLVGTWTAPGVATGLTGYRLQVARDAGFTVGVQNIDLGNVLTSTVTGLAGGRFYFARVAARTAGGVNTYSASRNTMLVLSAGDLDGWTRVGTKPAEISYYTAEGLRRGVVGSTQALWLESLSTGSVTLATDTYGIEKTVTGLTPTKTYRFEAKASLNGTPLADSYRLSIVSESDGTAETVTASTELPYIEFVADSSSVTFRIMLAEEVTVVGAQESVERVAIHGIKVLELSTDYPQRLRETVFESNLANHFDMACNSVGASWYVAKDGITRFRLPGAALPVAAIFSDDNTPGASSYVDIVAGYDTRSTVNRIEATNYGVDAERVNEENQTVVVEDSESVTAYGTRSVYFDLNLWDESPYDESFDDRLADLLESHSEPELLISQFRWNAQEDTELASALEVGDRLTVIYRGTTQDSQIVAINHDITPTRWMVTIDLQSL